MTYQTTLFFIAAISCSFASANTRFHCIDQDNVAVHLTLAFDDNRTLKTAGLSGLELPGKGPCCKPVFKEDDAEKFTVGRKHEKQFAKFHWRRYVGTNFDMTFQTYEHNEKLSLHESLTNRPVYFVVKDLFHDYEYLLNFTCEAN